ncbi:1-acyl-sn-glycerol-3-phosphate acyltransferase [Arsenicitalea aurantiaca]|uniref:1-acyl-sn-glycerol-3-phosphate acyltransferase n=1 Tax=Arsenicitalea aurantiaca TaxID=1783274 RepID=A0A433X5X3_9HYPH|nr:1-acyl-sn-glycerol-3-phosphate acyltransferase [Arsenicitalea aurantiaca]RUT29437.1 1-acyl-sn-glycerol-3-phosphate acyltransferase [Arsenicitalea aurantiaca]
MIVQAIRSLVFYALFFIQTTILALFVGTLALILRRHTRFTWGIARYWSDSNLFLLRWIVGIRTEVTGQENIPEGGCIIAAKHQSDWDIYAILPHTGRPAFIAKRELLDIPFFGWAARSLDTIEVDRKRGAQAIPVMMADAKAAADRGCRIIIFPEGTRRPPLAPPAYRQGIVRLYESLGVPVVPVALNSGLYWGRNSLVLWPGTAKARFLPAIPAGLPGDVFRARLEAEIEPVSTALAAEAIASGLSRPVPQEWRDRVSGHEPQ